jgi:hypothetical protein
MDEFRGQVVTLVPADNYIPFSAPGPGGLPIIARLFSITADKSLVPLRIFEGPGHNFRLGYPQGSYSGNQYFVRVVFVGTSRTRPEYFRRQVAMVTSLSSKLGSYPDSSSSFAAFQDLNFELLDNTGFQTAIMLVSPEIMCPIILVCAEGRFCHGIRDDEIDQIVTASMQSEPDRDSGPARSNSKVIAENGNKGSRDPLQTLPSLGTPGARQPVPQGPSKAAPPAPSAPVQPIARPTQPAQAPQQGPAIDIKLYTLKVDQADLYNLQVSAAPTCHAALRGKVWQTNAGNATHVTLEADPSGKPPSEVCVVIRRPGLHDAECFIMPFGRKPTYSIPLPDSANLQNLAHETCTNNGS